MSPALKKSVSPISVIIAFATVYIVWGSTYFFIRFTESGGFPPFLLGSVRFIVAGLIMMAWCVINGEKIFIKQNIIHAAVSGTLLLFVGNGAVIWAELVLPSGMVAILASSTPIWFVLMDKWNWGINFKSKSTILGLVIGFAGLYYYLANNWRGRSQPGRAHSALPWMFLIFIGTLGWAGGSLYSKYKLTTGSAPVNTAWQMLAAGVMFIPGSFLRHEFTGFNLADVPAISWMGLSYLVVFGSIAGFSAYVWLLQVRPATQVSTYAYVNPVIAVILGVVFAHENITGLQIAGLFVILGSVLLINLAKYRSAQQATDTGAAKKGVEEEAVA